MQPTPSTGADWSDRDIAQVIAQAKLSRQKYLCDGHGRGVKVVGAIAAAYSVAFILVVGVASPRDQIFNHTVEIERLATQFAHAETILPQTVQEVSRLLRRPDYDCRQIICEAGLEKRNLAARNKLQSILARTTLQADAAAASR